MQLTGKKNLNPKTFSQPPSLPCQEESYISKDGSWTDFSCRQLTGKESSSSFKIISQSVSAVLDLFQFTPSVILIRPSCLRHACAVTSTPRRHQIYTQLTPSNLPDMLDSFLLTSESTATDMVLASSLSPARLENGMASCFCLKKKISTFRTFCALMP